MAAVLICLAGIGCSAFTKSNTTASAPPPPATAPAAKPEATLASEMQAPRSGVATGPTAAELRMELIRTKAQVNSVLDAMNQMAAQGGGDLRPAYDEFNREVDATQTQSERVRQQTEGMRSRGRDYFRSWQEQSLQISDPEIRTQAEQRRSDVRGDFNKLVGTMHHARDAFGPFISDLTDIRRYLSTDLTPKGVGAISPAIQKSNEDGAAVQKRLDAVIVELDHAAAEMAPTSAGQTARTPAAAPAAGSGTEHAAPAGAALKSSGSPQTSAPPAKNSSTTDDASK
jgi:hypothetical protein